MKKIWVNFNSDDKTLVDLILEYNSVSYYRCSYRYYHYYGKDSCVKDTDTFLDVYESLIGVNDLEISDHIYFKLLDLKMKDIFNFKKFDFYLFCGLEEHLI